jgi:hypothetical protein
MRKVVLVLCILSGSFTPVVAELSAKGAAFLQEIGIDPNAPLIKSIADDVVIHKGDPTMLDEFASKRMKNAVSRFIKMRTFIRDYRRDPKTPLPAGDDFFYEFLTDEERVIVKALLDKRNKEEMKKLEEMIKNRRKP